MPCSVFWVSVTMQCEPIVLQHSWLSTSADEALTESFLATLHGKAFQIHLLDKIDFKAKINMITNYHLSNYT